MATAEERKARARERRAQARAATAARKEALDEKIAPAAQRHGTDLRGPRVTVSDGHARIAKPWEHRDTLANVTLTRIQRHAAGILLTDWREVGGGIGSASNLEPRGHSTGGGEGSHERMVAQLRRKERLEGAVEALGNHWRLIRPVVLEGRPLASWAGNNGISLRNAREYLREGINVLVAYYIGMSAPNP